MSSFYAVIGNPIAHSRSPFIHHAFAQQCRKTVQYDRLLAPLDRFAATVEQFFDNGGSGLNVTVPFKEEAFQLAKANLSPQARMAEAVNTLWFELGEIHGCNTDGPGLVNDLQRLGFHPKGQRILVIGAGGATRGCVLPLLDADCAQLRIINRSPERAHNLVNIFSDAVPTARARLSAGGLEDTGGTWDIVINATSAGLHNSAPNTGPLHFSDHSLAYDMVYGTQPTPFMQQCTQAGAQAQADGLGMLVEQAAISFSIWHGGVHPETEPVLAALRQQLTAEA